MVNFKKILLDFQNDSADFEPIFLYFRTTINLLCKKFYIDFCRNDLFIALWNITKNINISKFDSDKDLNRYIYRSLKNTCIDLYHKQYRDKKVIYNSELTDIAIDTNYSSDLMDESLLFFNDLLIGLPENQKKIITLRYKDCLSDKEIADYLHISRQAVYKNRNSALKQITKSLSNSFI